MVSLAKAVLLKFGWNCWSLVAKSWKTTFKGLEKHVLNTRHENEAKVFLQIRNIHSLGQNDLIRASKGAPVNPIMNGCIFGLKSYRNGNESKINDGKR